MILCLYSYYEKNDSYKENLQFFLENGLNKDIDVKVIVNGHCSLDLSGIDAIYRENIGYDFGSYAFYINKYWNDIQKYSHIVFINNSVKGPFSESKNWHSQFIDLLTDDVKLVGTSINILTNFQKRIPGFDLPYTHVQSMVFALELGTLNFLKESIFGLDVLNMTNKEDVILYKEIYMSQLILKNSWNINCTLDKYKDIDYRKITQDINPTSYFGDPCYKNKYFGKTLSPQDGAIFIKTDPMRQLINMPRRIIL